MVQINFAQRQVNAKVVYYGPGMSGKTTNLEVVHQRAPQGNKGELTSISTDGDRTLFFDFMPLDLGTVAGMRTCFQIYTVPGQVYYNSTRKLVLQGTDGVVFVADSSASMVEQNLESLRNLEENLREYGKSLATLPHVIQYNKRDLPDALPVEELNRLLNQHNAPWFEAIANTGQGVFPTLKALAARVLESIHQSSGQGGVAAPRAQPQVQQQQQQRSQQMPAPAAPMRMPAQQQPMQVASHSQQGFAPAGGIPMQPAHQQMHAGHQGMPQGMPMLGQPGMQQHPSGQNPMMAPQYAAPAAPMPQMQPMQQMQQMPQMQPMQQMQQMPQMQQMQQPMMQQGGFPAQQHPDGGGGLQLAGRSASFGHQPPQMPNFPQSAAPMGSGGSGLGASPASMMRGDGAAAAPKRASAPAAKSSRAPANPLEGTRFRPRAARQEPQPTPVAKKVGKTFLWVFVGLAVGVGGLVTWLLLTFF